MSSIDRRIVEAQFNNRQFQKGVKGTLDSLSELKRGLRLDGATRGISDVEKAANSVDMKGLGDEVSGVSSKFSVLQTIAVGALLTIGNRIAQVSGRIVKEFTVQPLIDGMQEYETNLNSIQTILSNTAWEDKTLEDVNAALNELNQYADLTIYNFAEMARNIGTFTAAGVELDTSVNAIKGIANLAAVSGSNSQQASTAMYQLSQALSTGTVRLMDWNSVVNAGMGGRVFQDAIKETARAHGVAIDSIIEDAGSFRDSLQSGWFTAEILTDALSTFTGDLGRAELEAMGYAEDAIDTILATGADAVDAATKVKTFTQLMDVAKEAVGTGWADTWTIVFGDFEEARELWTNTSEFIGDYISEMSNARNATLQVWKDMGGRTALIDGVKNVFASLWSVVKPIKEAFEDFFPGLSGKDLYDLTVGFRDFFETFKMGEEDADNLKRTFDGVFSVIGLGWELLSEIGGFLTDVILHLAGGADDLLEVTGNLGESIQNFYDRVKGSEDLSEFFDDLTNLVLGGVEALQEFASWLAEALNLDNFDYQDVVDNLAVLVELGGVMSTVWTAIGGVFEAVFDRIGAVLSGLGQFILDLPANLADYFAQVDWNFVLASINTGLFGAFLVMFQNFVNRMGGSGILGSLEDLSEVFGDSIDGITDALDGVTGTLSTMQNTLRAATLLQIALSLGVMAASLTQLARIDSDDLAKALSAMAGLFVELGAALVGLQFLGGIEGFNRTATGLILLATAIKILASTMEDMGALSWDEINKGLTAVAGLLTAVIATTAVMPTSAGLISTATGLVILSAGIKVLASTVEDLSDLDWEEMYKGLLGVGQLLVGLTIFTNLVKVNKGAIAQGAGFVLLGAAIKILASATKDFAQLDGGEMAKGLGAIGAILAAFAIFSQTTNPAGILATGASLLIVSGAMMIMSQALQEFGSMSWDEIGRGLTVMAGALIAVGTALTLIPPTSVISAAALVIASGGITALAYALKVMASMGWEEIAKAGVVLGGTLALLAAGLTAMSGSLLGSASLLVAAAALSTLAPVLYLLGGLEWSDIGKGLAVLAGAFVILGVAGYALAPTVPTFLGLAAAFLLIGGGAALLGIGLNLVAQAISLLAGRAADLATVLTVLVEQMVTLMPTIAEGLANGFIAFVNTIASASDGLIDAFVTIFMSILDAVREILPELTEIVLEAILNLVEGLRDVVPPMVDAALEMMTGIFEAVKDNAPAIVTEFTEMVVALLTTLAENTSEMVAAGVEVLAAFISGIAENLGDVITAGTDLIIAFIEGIASNAVRLADAAMEAIIDFTNGLTEAVEEHLPEILEAGENLAFAIVDGMTGGLASKVRSVAEEARNLATSAIDTAKDILGVESPSKVFKEIGEFVGEGFAEGLVGSRDDVVRSWDSMLDLIERARDSAERNVETLTDRLERLESAKDKDLKQIKETRAELEQANYEYNKTFHLHKQMNGMYKDERQSLERLGNQYDANQEKLQDANRDLQDAINTHRDYQNSIEKSFGDPPDLSKAGLSVLGYTNQLRESRDQVVEFSSVLQGLRKRGLGDAVYKELLDAGPDALPFVRQLEGSSDATIQELNTLSESLTEQAKKLGTQAANSLYQAGIDAAQGIVDGLEEKESDIREQMERIAGYMIDELTRKLDIQSPSRVMRTLGSQTVEGLAKGMSDASSMVADAAKGVGDEAINTMRKSISDLSDMIDLDADMRPRITPIIDLSEIKKGAAQIDSEFGSPIRIGGAFSKAKDASAKYRANLDAEIDSEMVRPSEKVSMTYIQNNNSPKALSSAEIYRQTRNQLSKTKGALRDET